MTMKDDLRIARDALTTPPRDTGAERRRWEGMTGREKRQARVFGAALFVASIAVVLLDVLTNTRAF